MKKYIPSEHEEQSALFEWAEAQSNKIKELSLLYAIPNGGKRYVGTAIKLKKEGVKSGVPDTCLPVARKQYYGLYMEMKKKGGVVTENQKKWIQALKEQGYFVCVCYGFEEAKNEILNYLCG